MIVRGINPLYYQNFQLQNFDLVQLFREYRWSPPLRFSQTCHSTVSSFLQLDKETSYSSKCLVTLQFKISLGLSRTSSESHLYTSTVQLRNPQISDFCNKIALPRKHLVLSDSGRQM